jgi:C-terminal processing protease CtpA/Prc
VRAAFAFGLGIFVVGVLQAAPQRPAAPNPAVFDAVWQKVKSGFYDPELHGKDWEAIGNKYRPLARKARTERQLHRVLDRMFGELGASHLAIIDGDYCERHLLKGAKGQVVPHYGFFLTHLDEGFFVSKLLHGGPARVAGVKRGDRLISIDGLPPHPDHLTPKPYESFFGGPRSYMIFPQRTGEKVDLQFQRTPRPMGRYRVVLEAHPWNEIEAGRESGTIIERGGFKLGYMQLYHLLSKQVVVHLAEFLKTHRDEIDGMIVDLRGTGGAPKAADLLIDLFDPQRVGSPATRLNRRYVPPSPSGAFFGKPVVALIDQAARSVKEVVAFNWRRQKIGPLVGQTTRGAVLGAMYANGKLADGHYLMVPMMDVRTLTGGVTLENHGVEPDVFVKNPLPYAAGRDAVIEQGVETLLEQILAARRRGKRGGWH